MPLPSGAQPARARERRALSSAVAIAGAGEVVDFLLPLFAAASLGLPPSSIGILLSVELAVSLVVRPVAGHLADRYERRTFAALGALLYAISCAGYALAQTAPLAYGAAAIGGVGGALLWVSLRAMIGERLAEDSGVFAKLVAAEETGSWVVFVPVIVLIGAIGYQVVFAALVVCCLVGAALLLTAPKARPAAPEPETDPHEQRLLPRLTPMLLAVALTMTAEGVISFLMLLHLQSAFDLEPMEIAMVFLPGAIAMGALPPYLHGFVRRYGRSRMLALGSVASAVFAVSLAFAPSPLVVAVCWVLAGISWALIFPIQQAVIAEASGSRHLGRGLGWYETASLAGGLVGTLVGGFVYELGSWVIACVASAAVILLGAVLVPAAVRALGVEQFPAPPVPDQDEDAREGEDAEESARRSTAGASGVSEVGAEDDRTAKDEEKDEERDPTRGELVSSFGWHTVILIAALVGCQILFDDMTISQVYTVPEPPPQPFEIDPAVDWLVDQLMDDGTFVTALRVWSVIWAIDLISTLWKLPRAPRFRVDAP